MIALCAAGVALATYAAEATWLVLFAACLWGPASVAVAWIEMTKGSSPRFTRTGAALRIARVTFGGIAIYGTVVYFFFLRSFSFFQGRASWMIFAAAGLVGLCLASVRLVPNPEQERTPSLRQEAALALFWAVWMVSGYVMDWTLDPPGYIYYSLPIVFADWWSTRAKSFATWADAELTAHPLRPCLAEHRALRRAHLMLAAASAFLPERLAREELGDALERADDLAERGARAWRLDALWISATVGCVANALRDLPRRFVGRMRPRGR